MNLEEQYHMVEDFFLESMKHAVCVSEDDKEQGHDMADSILCGFLKYLGYTRIVDEFDKVKKWYA